MLDIPIPGLAQRGIVNGKTIKPEKSDESSEYGQCKQVATLSFEALGANARGFDGRTSLQRQRMN